MNRTYGFSTYNERGQIKHSNQLKSTYLLVVSNPGMDLLPSRVHKRMRLDDRPRSTRLAVRKPVGMGLCSATRRKPALPDTLR